MFQSASGKKGHSYLKPFNRKMTFKDPETGAHTNSIEEFWAHAKRSLPIGCRRKHFYPGYLAKFLFLKRCRAQHDPFEEFCKVADRLYNPLCSRPEVELESVPEEGAPSEEEEEGDIEPLCVCNIILSILYEDSFAYQPLRVWELTLKIHSIP